LVLWEESKRALNSRKDFLKPTLDMAFEIIGRGITGRNEETALGADAHSRHEL
jgi:hypothetical protein